MANRQAFSQGFLRGHRSDICARAFETAARPGGGCGRRCRWRGSARSSSPARLRRVSAMRSLSCAENRPGRQHDRCDQAQRRSGEPLPRIRARPCPLAITSRILSSKALPSRGFSTIGTRAFAARSRSDGLGWLVIRIAGAENCAGAQQRDQIEPAHSGIFWSTTRQSQRARSPAPSSSAPFA